MASVIRGSFQVKASHLVGSYDAFPVAEFGQGHPHILQFFPHGPDSELPAVVLVPHRISLKQVFGPVFPTVRKIPAQLDRESPVFWEHDHVFAGGRLDGLCLLFCGYQAHRGPEMEALGALEALHGRLGQSVFLAFNPAQPFFVGIVDGRQVVGDIIEASLPNEREIVDVILPGSGGWPEYDTAFFRSQDWNSDIGYLVVFAVCHQYPVVVRIKVGPSPWKIRHNSLRRSVFHFDNGPMVASFVDGPG